MQHAAHDRRAPYGHDTRVLETRIDPAGVRAYAFPVIPKAFAVFGLIIGCSPARSEAPDASDLCGNGVREEHSEGGTSEQCDEGVLNGTPDSHCTKQCHAPLGVVPPASGSVDLGASITRAFDVRGHEQRFVTLSEEDGTIRLWRESTVPNIVELKVAEPAVSLGAFGNMPIWIENAQDGSHHFYLAELGDTADSPIIHELSYPLSDGLEPRLVSAYSPEYGPLVIDHNATGDLLVTALIVRSPTDVMMFSSRFPAPAGTPGTTVDTGFYRDHIRERWRRELVVFFDHPGSFVKIDVIVPSYPNPTPPEIAFAEASRGSWPTQVVTGDRFEKLCGDGTPSQWAPRPIAVLNDRGEIFTSQFERGLSDGEAFQEPFARVAPGTQALNSVDDGVVVIEPDGTGVYLTDGDCRDTDSNAISPSRGPYTQPAARMRLNNRDSNDNWIASAGFLLYLN